MSQDWTPLDPETLVNPHETFANLRGTCPVPHSDEWDGFWSLLRHEDIAKASVDGRTYISSVQNVVPHVGMGKRIPLHVDPPIHTFYRRVLSSPFQPDNIFRLEPTIREMVVELLEPLLDAGKGDYIDDFTYHLPTRVLCAFLNIPQEDATAIKDHSERYALALETGDRDSLQVESDALYEYARRYVAYRKQNLLNPCVM